MPKNHGAGQPRIIIVAGPNGAGKTTFAREFLPREAHCPLFINADLIAAGLSPFAPERAAIQAGRLMLQSIARHVARQESFALETTLSGLGYARQIPRWRQAGFRVELYFFRLSCAEKAVSRVAQRVKQGGHDIPEATIRRRFATGKVLFATVYQPLVDCWVQYDNEAGERMVVDWGGDALEMGRVAEPRRVYAGMADDLPAGLQGSLAALRRASLRAAQVARQTAESLAATV